MSKVHTAFSPLDTSSFNAPVGEKTKDEFVLKIEPDGNRVLEKVGVKDMYSVIQSHKESSLIENVVLRALNGDPSALKARQGVYCDMSAMPSDLISAHEAISKAEDLFCSLPRDVRSKFSTFKEFLETYSSPEKLSDFYENLTRKDLPDQVDHADGTA